MKCRMKLRILVDNGVDGLSSRIKLMDAVKDRVEVLSSRKS